MSATTPRAVFVTRETDFELLIARHATRDQARAFRSVCVRTRRCGHCRWSGWTGGQRCEVSGRPTSPRHQSARYTILDGTQNENHSSSGLIVASGTGATGWARSIMEATGTYFDLDPQERAIVYFVREPYPSVKTCHSQPRAG